MKIKAPREGRLWSGEKRSGTRYFLGAEWLEEESEDEELLEGPEDDDGEGALLPLEEDEGALWTRPEEEGAEWDPLEPEGAE
jgi:hypothetical protein